MSEQAGFAQAGLDEALLDALIAEHEAVELPRMETLWRYYRNPVEPVAGEGVGGAGRKLAQRDGLPRRLTGRVGAHEDDRAASRREIVIENDIAWRVHTMVDFMFGKPVRLRSTASDAALRDAIDRLLDAVWEASGGIALLQDMALLGHVYGHVDLIVRTDADRLGDAPALRQREGALSDTALRRIADAFLIEPVEPKRGIPVLDPGDYRRLASYVIHYERTLNEVAEGGRFGRWLGLAGVDAGARRRSTLTEIIEPGRRWVFEDGELIAEDEDRLLGDTLPVVHIQNIAQPFHYSGLSEVEPLVPLQDELNTRLSDRASRVTLQSFKMYLARGIEGFDRVPVGPGQVWSTDNPDASVEAFGGDAASPSEDAHIKEVRDALDKTSAVPPLATGVVQGRVGNLSSANALKITLVGLLAKTARKRVTYGRGIAQVSELILRALDTAGVLRTGAADRGVRLEWPDPLPEDVLDETLAAKRKIDLGVSAERVRDELGYEPTDGGVL